MSRAVEAIKYHGIRDDCERDVQAVICPNAVHLGYSTNKAKRGSWITYETDDHHRAGRVVGRVKCEGKTYLEIVTWDTALTFAYVRWIEAHRVRECYNQPHRRVIDFLTGPWDDLDTILNTAQNGMVRQEGDE